MTWGWWVSDDIEGKFPQMATKTQPSSVSYFDQYHHIVFSSFNIYVHQKS